MIPGFVTRKKTAEAFFDLRSMEVCSALKERYAQTIAELKEACQGLPTAAQETKILQKSMEFCKEATAAGYGILWDPQA